MLYGCCMGVCVCIRKRMACVYVCACVREGGIPQGTGERRKRLLKASAITEALDGFI